MVSRIRSDTHFLSARYHGVEFVFGGNRLPMALSLHVAPRRRRFNVGGCDGGEARATWMGAYPIPVAGVLAHPIRYIGLSAQVEKGYDELNDLSLSSEHRITPGRRNRSEESHDEYFKQIERCGRGASRRSRFTAPVISGLIEGSTSSDRGSTGARVVVRR
jgi:hypothetical protein